MLSKLESYHIRNKQITALGFSKPCSFGVVCKATDNLRFVVTNNIKYTGIQFE